MRRTTAAMTVVMALFAAATGAAADKSSYTLLRPVPDSQLRDMSTDRPDKTESPYTVDAGRIQIETDLVAFTRDKSEGIKTETFDVLPFNFKVGLTNATDLQALYGSYSHVRTSTTGITDKESGFGDLVVRVKHNVWGNDGGPTALGVMPFLKLPVGTLADLNDDVEGGIIVPLAIDIGNGLGLGLMTEVDILKASDGHGYEPTFVNSATVSFEITDRLGVYVEAFIERSSESGAETVVTLDGGFTYAMTDNLQLDAGANIGVTDAADDLNVFVGLSQRY